jgi:hypothetical protein
MKISRFIIIFFVLIFTSFLIHSAADGFNYSITSISNALFIVGIVLTMTAIVALTNAYQVFHGFRYAIRAFISTSFRREYPNFRDYKEEKTVHTKSSLFLEVFLASVIILVVSIILAGVA